MNDDQHLRLTEELRRLEAEQIKPKSGQTIKTSPTAFDKVLSGHMQQPSSPEPISFSNHAIQRLQKRNIRFGPAQMERLNDALSKLRSKGARESLVLLDEMALIVGVKHNTVITAMDRQSMKGNIITNIDSAIIT